jgi:hypothetical protein
MLVLVAIREDEVLLLFIARRGNPRRLHQAHRAMGQLNQKVMDPLERCDSERLKHLTWQSHRLEGAQVIEPWLFRREHVLLRV